MSINTSIRKNTVSSGVIRTRLADVLLRFLLAGWAMIILLPVFWVLVTSFKTNREFFMSAWELPAVWQLVNYSKAWLELGIGRSFFNTIYLVGGAMLLNTLVISLCCYILARFKFWGRDVIYWYIIGSYFIHGLNTLITEYILMRQLGLVNSLSGLMVNFAAGSLVFNILIMVGFMKGQPKELEESAYIDGASYWQTFWHIGLPLARPAILIINVFNFMGYYNNFIKPLIYLRDPETHPLAVAVYSLSNAMQYRADWVTLFAGFVIMIIPKVIIYTTFQRQITQNLMIGSLKG